MPRKEGRDKYIASGLCGSCGKDKPLAPKKTCETCLAAIKLYTKSCSPISRSKIRLRNNRRTKFIRDVVLDHYGRVCVCCGETTEQFLSIDHIENNGADHRREVRGRNGGTVYSWLIKNEFPKGFQILCYNCNFAKGRYGICPHEAARTTERLNTGKIQQTRESMLGAEGNAVPKLLN